MKKVIFLGAGGFAREILDTVDTINQHTDDTIEPIGFVYDGGKKDKEILIHNIPVLGEISTLKDIDTNNIFLVAAAGRSVWRRKMVEEAKKYGTRFISIIHPTSLVSKWAQLGEGAVIQSFCCINPNVKIGSFFSCNGSVRIGHDTVIGDYVHVNPTVNISGGTVIEDDVFIGVKATILPSIIGAGSIIGSCALITKDVPKNIMAKGIPAKYSEISVKNY